MSEKTINEFYDIVITFDLIFYALKWQCLEYEDSWKYNSIIKILDSMILKLKHFGINNVGCIEEE